MAADIVEVIHENVTGFIGFALRKTRQAGIYYPSRQLVQHKLNITGTSSTLLLPAFIGAPVPESQGIHATVDTVIPYCLSSATCRHSFPAGFKLLTKLPIARQKKIPSAKQRPPALRFCFHLFTPRPEYTFYIQSFLFDR